MQISACRCLLFNWHIHDFLLTTSERSATLNTLNKNDNKCVETCLIMKMEIWFFLEGAELCGFNFEGVVFCDDVVDSSTCDEGGGGKKSAKIP